MLVVCFVITVMEARSQLLTNFSSRFAIHVPALLTHFGIGALHYFLALGYIYSHPLKPQSRKYVYFQRTSKSHDYNNIFHYSYIIALGRDVAIHISGAFLNASFSSYGNIYPNYTRCSLMFHNWNLTSQVLKWHIPVVFSLYPSLLLL